MAQEVRLQGRTYSDVPSVRLPDSNGVFHPFTDVSDTTATAADVATGKYFYLADGTKTQGTSSGGGGRGAVTQDQDGYLVLDDDAPAPSVTVESLSVTQNGTYTAPTGKAYSPVTVSVSGGTSKEAKQINFIDYDGTIVESYTAAEWANVSALPSNPSHTGLTAQGWNWTKREITAQLTASPNGDVWVGQMYVTTSGKTEIDVTFDNASFLSPYIAFSVVGTVTIDWGDGSATDSVTGTSISAAKYTQHTYSATGNYTISLAASDRLGLYTNSSGHTSILYVGSTADNQRASTAYSRGITNIRLGNGVTLYSYSFNKLPSLETVTMPSSITSLGSNYPFTLCTSLKSVTVPAGVTTLPSYAFNYCSSLTTVSIPPSITTFSGSIYAYATALRGATIPKDATTFNNYLFQHCYSLEKALLASGITSLPAYMYYNCYTLKSAVIPSTVTSIGNGVFYNCTGLREITIPSGVTTIGNSVFQTCSSIRHLTIPATVTSIGNTAFSNMYGVTEFHVLRSTPPTLGTNVFQNIGSYTKIYVPSASLASYQADSAWSAYSSYLVGE